MLRYDEDTVGGAGCVMRGSVIWQLLGWVAFALNVCNRGRLA